MPSIVDFTAPRHFRGRITNERTAAVYQFTINPAGFKDKKGSYIEEDPIPGFSDPKLAWAGGKVSTVRLHVELDAELTFKEKGAAFFNRTDENYDPDQFTIRNEIAFFNHFQYPGKPENGGRGADVLLLTYGSYFQGAAFFLDDIDIDVFELSPEGEPTKARIDLVLKRIIDDNTFAEDVFQP
jgi:hypothetical protein